MSEHVLIAQRRDEFVAFCADRGIQKPYVFLDRSRNDTLTETIKCSATRNASVLGIGLFKVSCFHGLHVVNEVDFHITRERFEDCLADREACRTLTEQVKESRLLCAAVATEIRSVSPGDSSQEMVGRFVRVRQKRAILMYVFELYQRFLASSITKVLSVAARRIARVPQPDLYHRLQSQRYAFVSQEQPFEFVAHQAYRDLWDVWTGKGAQSAEFLRAFEEYCDAFGGTDARGFRRAAEGPARVMSRLRGDLTRPALVVHDSARIRAGKRELWIATVYDFEEMNRHAVVGLDVQMTLMDSVLYEESWGRPAVSRLDISIYPHFREIERRLVAARLLPASDSVFDLEVGRLDGMLTALNSMGVGIVLQGSVPQGRVV